MLAAIVRWFGRLVVACPHRRTYRERRPLKIGLVGPAPGSPPAPMVLHFVCEDCGHAEPCLDRTPEEHRRVVAEGAPRRPRAIKMIQVDLYAPSAFRLALDDQITAPLVECLWRLQVKRRDPQRMN